MCHPPALGAEARLSSDPPGCQPATSGQFLYLGDHIRSRPVAASLATWPESFTGRVRWHWQESSQLLAVLSRASRIRPRQPFISMRGRFAAQLTFTMRERSATSATKMLRQEAFIENSQLRNAANGESPQHWWPCLRGQPLDDNSNLGFSERQPQGMRPAVARIQMLQNGSLAVDPQIRVILKHVDVENKAMPTTGA